MAKTRLSGTRALGYPRQDRVGKRWYVVQPLTQPWHAQLNHVQAIEQILPESPGCHERAEVLMRGADQPHIDWLLRGGAHFAYFAFLYRA